MDKNIYDKYQAVIGLEVHAQLLTKSKIYNSDATKFGDLPNTNISAITLGHPGTLPKLNKKVVEYAIKMGLACESTISMEQTFDRKNYFYPDLPKGYQITQDKTPICVGGEILVRPINGEKRKIRLNRIHIEEDAGKSLHLDEETDTLVDFNRAGVALIEIVSEPDMRTSEEAASFLTEIRKLVRYLEICDGNMEEGSLRCDANISVMLKDAREYGKKVEVKNMNSMRNVQKAIDFEIHRQIDDLERGQIVISETRHFDVASGTTSSMRAKEELNDYRYFPDPDLSPLVISEDWLESIKDQMPSLPNELVHKFVNEYQLSEYDALVLTDSKDICNYFIAFSSETTNYKAASNWIMGPIKSYLNDNSKEIIDFKLSVNNLAKIIDLVDQNVLSFSTASQKLFPALIEQVNEDPLKLAEQMNLIQDSDSGNIELLIDQIILKHPQKVAEYRKGKKGLLGMFMGEVMKLSNGKADPQVAKKVLIKKMDLK